MVVIAPKKRVDIRGVVEKYGVATGALAVISTLGLAIPSTLLGLLKTPALPESLVTTTKIGMDVDTGQPVTAAAPEAVANTMPLWMHEAVMVLLHRRRRYPCADEGLRDVLYPARYIKPGPMKRFLSTRFF